MRTVPGITQERLMAPEDAVEEVDLLEPGRALGVGLTVAIVAVIFLMAGTIYLATFLLPG
jgi:hypothetical protein